MWDDDEWYIKNGYEHILKTSPKKEKFMEVYRIRLESVPTRIYKLPARFYWDHWDRELPSGDLVRETGRYVVVKLDQEAYADLLSDARFYSDPRDFEGDLRGLCASARATRKRLEEDGPVEA